MLISVVEDEDGEEGTLGVALEFRAILAVEDEHKGLASLIQAR